MTDGGGGINTFPPIPIHIHLSTHITMVRWTAINGGSDGINTLPPTPIPTHLTTHLHGVMVRWWTTNGDGSVIESL